MLDPATAGVYLVLSAVHRGRLPGRGRRRVECEEDASGTMLDQRDRELAAASRDVLTAPGLTVRSILPRLLSDYLQAYLCVYLRRRRFGFDRPVREIAEEVANLELGTFLQGGDAGALRAALARRFGPVLSEEGEPLPVSDLDDERLVAATKELLRLLARQGATRAWKRDHPAEARLLRSVKSRIRQTERLRIDRHAAGQMVISRSSDPCLRPLDLAELTEVVQAVRPPYRAKDVAAALIPGLAPAGGHGGYCYLMDLVRAVHFLRVESFLSDANRFDLQGMVSSEAIGHNGVPFETRLKRTVETLTRWADEYVAADAAKRERLRPGTGIVRSDHRRLLTHLAIDRLLSPVGLGRAEWEGLPLETLLARVFPAVTGDHDPRPRVTDVEYLVRRLRRRLRQRGRELE